MNILFNYLRKGLLIVSLCPITLFSQVTLRTEVNMPQSGDLLNMHWINCQELKNGGANAFWDLSNSKVTDKEMAMSYQLVKGSTDSLVRIEPFSISHYKINNDSLQLTALEAPNYMIHFLQPIKEFHYPFSYGDSIVGNIQGKGRYREEVPICVYGNYRHVADAKGTLVLPEGDTIKNVLRTCFERTYRIDNLTDFKDLDTVRCLSDDELTAKIKSGAPQFKTALYRWYVEGYRYPFLEALYTENGQGPNKDRNVSVYYCTSEGQDVFGNSNDDVLRKNAFSVKNREDSSNRESLDYYSIEQTGDSQFHLTCQFQKPVSMAYSVYATDGMTLYESGEMSVDKGFYNSSFNVPLNKTEVAIFILQVNGKRYTEKIIVERQK